MTIKTISHIEEDIKIKVAVVIPCYRVIDNILNVISLIGEEVSQIYVIDDKCPDFTGDYVKDNCTDSRIKILRHLENQGVGAAVLTGYYAAISDKMDIIVKIDGDGQMDPRLLPAFISPIISGEADYTKGNRFFKLEEILNMPTARLLGNAALSFMTKLSSGYWDIFDPTNGYTAIHANIAQHLPLKKISKRYFFESDMLFRLNTLKAVVIDIPMDAKYENEVSNLKIRSIINEFLFKHGRNFAKRIFYNYYLRDLSLASIELPIGVLLMFSGLSFGVSNWLESSQLGVTTPAGTVMLAALPMLIGLQLILSFLAYDITSVPRFAMHKRLASNLTSHLKNI